MFRLVRWLFSLFLFALVVWFATSVPLGNKTLWGHLHAIFATKEAKDLADGTEEEARKVADRVRAELAGDGGAPRRARAPLDPVNAREQRDLDRLVREKTK